jgi:hypothetical protein
VWGKLGSGKEGGKKDRQRKRGKKESGGKRSTKKRQKERVGKEGKREEVKELAYIEDLCSPRHGTRPFHTHPTLKQSHSTVISQMRVS